jgi:fibronectin type 3 domain-containing protein
MRKTFASLAMAAIVGTANAAVTAYEPFNYSAGTLANGTASTAAGFSGNWTVSAFPQIVNTVLTYPSLTPVNRAYQHAAAGAQTTVGLASPLSSGTKYISYLFKGSGNSGGDTVGVFFKGSNATSLFAGFRVPNTGTETGFGLGTVNSTTLGGATALGSAVNINNTATHFIVIQIDFDTAGALDTVSLWIDPPANAATPGVAANVVNSTFDVGTIGAFGINITGGYNPILDEIRIGDTYGDVTAYVPPPDAPTGLVATPGDNTVSLSWDVTSGATGYQVLRGTSTGVYTVTNSVASNTNFDATVVGGTTYFYAVQATNASGGGALSAEVSVTPTIALPSTPTGFTATGTNSAVLLSWNAASGASGYNIKRATTSGAEVAIASTDATSYTDAAVVNGTTYFYTVSATNSAGESADSLEASAVPNVPPATPTALIATAGSNQVSLSWTGAAGAASYNVKRSTTSGSGYTTIGTTIDPTVVYVDATAVKFTQYYYVVSAVNAYGESADSSPEATATPTGAYGPTAYEPFNYTAGAFANNTPSTAAGFTGNWTIPTGATIASGRTYTTLPVAGNAYQHNASGSQNTVNFASPMSSGTKYISFLIKNSGNSGGDTVGVFLKGNNASSLFAGFRGGFTGSETLFGLGSVNSTSLGGASGLGSGTVPLSNTATNFIVLKIEFNTSGANETISLWTNPPVNAIVPGGSASVTATTFDVGTISSFGINILGGYAAVIDEIRVGDVYGDVVGYSEAPPAPTIATTVSLSVAQGEQISWTASSANTYQPQKSADNSVWSNVGSLLIGDAVTSVYETTSASYYRVLEFVAGGPGADEMVNGSFEDPAANNIGAANWNGPASNGTVNQYVTNQFDVLLPTEGTNLLFIEGQGGSGSLVQSDFVPISGGLTYKVVFDAANPLKSGGGNPQFRVEFFDAGNGLVGSSGFVSFASAGSSWVTFSNNYAAPANATKLIIGFLEAVGAGPTDHWITVVDNVTVSALATIGSTNVLTATRQLGAVFTGTVQTNGVTATAATGTITFQTNSAALSTNTVAAGSATSATAIVTPPYTVTAIYSGDSTYIGSTNTLTVNNATATVTLDSLNQTFDGTAKSATATIAPAGLTVAFTYDGSSDAPTNAGTYTVIGSVVDALYVGSATNNLVITKAAATVTLLDLNQTYNGTARTVTATTVPNGLNVTFTYDGSANAPTNIGTYEVIGTVVELNYEGSATNSLVVVSGISTTPTNITSSVTGNQLTITWPESHLGWVLQAQTNDLSVGIGSTWFDVAGSEAGTQTVITIDPVNPTVFFRLRYP